MLGTFPLLAQYWSTSTGSLFRRCASSLAYELMQTCKRLQHVEQHCSTCDSQTAAGKHRYIEMRLS